MHSTLNPSIITLPGGIGWGKYFLPCPYALTGRLFEIQLHASMLCTAFSTIKSPERFTSAYQAVRVFCCDVASAAPWRGRLRPPWRCALMM